MQRTRIERKADIRIACFKLVGSVRLSYHATSDSDYRIGMLFFDMLIFSYKRKCPCLGVLSHGAGVDQYKSGVRGLVNGTVAHQRAKTRKAFAVSLVLLAAECKYIISRRVVSDKPSLGKAVCDITRNGKLLPDECGIGMPCIVLQIYLQSAAQSGVYCNTAVYKTASVHTAHGKAVGCTFESLLGNPIRQYQLSVRGNKHRLKVKLARVIKFSRLLFSHYEKSG